mgnify:CR=1 FL=1
MLFIVNVNFVFSQQEKQGDIQPISKFLIKTNFKLPFPTSNYFMTQVAEGVVDLNGSFNVKLFKELYAGAGYKYSQFKLNEIQARVAPNDIYDGKIIQQGFYGELSYFFHPYEILSIEANFQLGQESVSATSKLCPSDSPGHSTKKGIFYSPNVNIYLKTEEVFSFFLSLGYQFSTTGFQPEDICRPSFENYEPADYTGNYQHINVGFGIGISLIKPQNKL